MIVHSESFQEHLTRLGAVVHQLKNAGLKLTRKMQNLHSHRHQILSCLIRMVSTDPAKVEKVRHLPVPRIS